MQIRILTILFLNTFSMVFGQHEKCATHDILKQNIEYYGSILEDEIYDLKNENRVYKSGIIFTIPVVFHIIHNGDSIGVSENLSDEIIIAQLNALNRDFRGLNEDSTLIPNIFKTLFTDAQIEFCLAKIKPDGGFTSGIERYNFNQDGWDLDSINSYIKPNTIWDRAEYLNIWSIKFKGNLENSLINGFAQPPFATLSNQTDGIVVRYDKLGANGRVAVHEIGHWLGLFHIWGDDNGLCSNDLTGGTDGIDDTPDQGGPYYNCPIGAPESCGSTDMFMNYMDYTDDECSLLFTSGQRNAMHQVLENFRASLQSSSVCNVLLDLNILKVYTPNTTVCQQSFYPHILVKNEGLDTIRNFNIDFVVNDSTYESKTWDITLAPFEEVDLFFSLHFFDSGNQYNTLFDITSVNSGANEYHFNNKKSINFNSINTGVGIETPYEENFETNLLSNLNIQNFDSDKTWTVINESDYSAIFMENFNYDIGEIDNLLTADFSIEGENPALNFEYAYKALNQIVEDTFTVFASQNCGIHWIKLWQKSGLELSNQMVETNYFSPILSDFISVNIDLSFLNNLEKVRFKFENKSGGGNNLYLNNFDIGYLPSDTLSLYFVDNIDFNLFPNPANNNLTVSMKSRGKYHLRITDLLGKIIFKDTFLNNEYNLNIHDLTKGVYYIQLKSENGSSETKTFFVK